MADHDFMKPVYEGDCAECGEVVRLQQGVTKTPFGYVHGTCIKRPEVCTKCFLTKPCECDS